jgi:hypothetical protein
MFTLAGLIGVAVTALARTSRSYRCLAAADVGAARAEPEPGVEAEPGIEIEVEAGARVPACAETPALAGATAA